MHESFRAARHPGYFVTDVQLCDGDVLHFFQEYFYLSFSASDVNNSGTPLHKGDKVEFYVATDKRYAPVTKYIELIINFYCHLVGDEIIVENF